MLKNLVRKNEQASKTLVFNSTLRDAAGTKKTPTLGSLLLGANTNRSQGLSGKGKSVVNSLVKGLVQANDLEDLIHFNESKQKMILSKIKEKMGELDISDEDLLKSIQEAVATKAEREAAREEKRKAIQAELEKRDLEALKQKLAGIKGQISAKVANIKDIKVRIYQS
jgi:DNA primase large subunit